LVDVVFPFLPLVITFLHRLPAPDWVGVEHIREEVFQFKAEALTDGRLDAPSEAMQEDLVSGNADAEITVPFGSVTTTVTHPLVRAGRPGVSQ
jgi:hypothetical protein